MRTQRGGYTRVVFDLFLPRLPGDLPPAIALVLLCYKVDDLRVEPSRAQCTLQRAERKVRLRRVREGRREEEVAQGRAPWLAGVLRSILAPAQAARQPHEDQWRTRPRVSAVVYALFRGDPVRR